MTTNLLLYSSGVLLVYLTSSPAPENKLAQQSHPSVVCRSPELPAVTPRYQVLFHRNKFLVIKNDSMDKC
jgi:hypothetical protein